MANQNTDGTATGLQPLPYELLHTPYQILLQLPSPVAVMQGPDFTIAFVNDKLLQVWGVQREAVLGKPYFSVFPQTLQTGLDKIYRQVYNSGESFTRREVTHTYAVNGKDQVSTFNIVLSPLKNAAGITEGIMAAGYDVGTEVAARKKAEASEAFNRTILESNPDWVAVFDNSGRLHFMNVNGLRLLELENFEAVAYRPWSELWPEAFQPLAQAAVAKALHGETSRFEAFCPTATGKPKWWDVVVSPIPNNEKKVTEIIAVSRDVSSHKIAEEALRTSEDKYRRLFNAIDQGFSIIELIYNNQEHPTDFRFLEANPVFEKQTGVANPVGKTAGELFPRLEPKWYQVYHDILQTGVPRRFIDHTSVNDRHYETFAFRVGAKEQKQLAILFTDITAKKKAEQNLSESEERLRLVLDAAHIGLWDYNVLSNEATLSENTRAFYELEPGEIFSFERYLAAVHPDDRERVAEKNRFVLFEESAPLEFFDECRIVRKNGTIRWIRSIGKILLNGQGQRMRFIGAIQDITEEKNTAQALQESETRFRNLADNAPVMIWVTDAEGYCHYLNKQWLQFTGQTLEEGSGIGWSNAVHPDERTGAAEDFIKASAARKPFHKEYRLRRWDGVYEWMLDSAEPRLDEEGNFLGYIGSVVNIHQRKIYEQELQKLSYHLQLSTTAAGVGTWSYDIVRGTLEWSGLHKRMWGYQENDNDLHYEDWYKLIHPDDMQASVQRVENARITKTHYENEYRIQRADDGRIRWIRSFGQFIYDDAGEATVLTGVSIDITERKEAEEAIRESEERFRNLADNAPMWVFLSDENINITYVNKEELSFFGLTQAEEFLSKTWEQKTHPDDIANVYTIYNEAVQKGIPYSLEARMFNANTQQYEWFHFRGVPRMENGVFKGIIGTGINIHQQKLLTGQLEDLVRQRTAALQRSNADLQQFAHVASHDLKEPVRKIRTFLSRIHLEYGNVVPPKMQDYLTKVETSARRMTDMIEGVLRYSALDAGELKKERVDLNLVLDEVQDDLELSIQQKKAVLHIGPLPVLEGTTILLYQMFYNLVNNALKFAKPDQPAEIRISATGTTTACTHSEQRVDITVEDNGIGFHPDFAEKIFQTFTRLNSKDQYEGTGLGLALCQKIAERHGGSIRAEGAPGHGARFIVTLACSAAAPATPSKAE